MTTLSFQPLRRALTKMGASAQLLQSLMPDSQDNSLSFSVLNYLKRLKNQAKVEFEKLCADVINKSSSNNTQKVCSITILSYIEQIRQYKKPILILIFIFLFC